MIPRLPLAGAVAAAALLAVPASASAITVTPIQACQTVESGGGVLATVTGGTPNGPVVVASDVGSASGLLDGAGAVQPSPFSFGAPSGRRSASRGRTLDLSATDQTTGQTATASATYTRRAATITSGRSSRSSSRRWRVSGLRPLTGLRSVYASWYRGGKLVRRVRLGVSNNACGYLSVRRSADPGRTIGGRRFTIRIHSQKRYSAKAPRITGFRYTRLRR